MPIFEYVCKGCGAQFEVLVRGSDKAHCPKCKSTRLEQQLSAFAVAGRGNGGSTEFASEPAPGGCGSCGTGDSCAFDED